MQINADTQRRKPSGECRIRGRRPMKVPLALGLAILALLGNPSTSVTQESTTLPTPSCTWQVGDQLPPVPGKIGELLVCLHGGEQVGPYALGLGARRRIGDRLDFIYGSQQRLAASLVCDRTPIPLAQIPIRGAKPKPTKQLRPGRLIGQQDLFHLIGEAAKIRSRCLRRRPGSGSPSHRRPPSPPGQRTCRKRDR